MINIRKLLTSIAVSFISLALLVACSVESAPIPAVFKATQQVQQPTGSLIYLSEHALHKYDLATKTTTELKAASYYLQNAATGFYLSLTPDGRTLLFNGYDPLIGCTTFRPIFSCTETGPNGFFTYDFASDWVNLIRPYTLSNISLSPDGRKLAYTVLEYDTPDYQVHLKLSAIDGGEPDALSASHVVDSFPSWSPDGEWIAFYRAPSPDPNAEPCTAQAGLFDTCSNPYPSLYLIHPDQSGLTKLLPDIRLFYAPYNQPSWSYDGKSLAVIAGSTEPNVTFIEVASGKTTTLKGIAPSSVPVWSPTARMAVFSTGGIDELESYLVLYEDASASWRIIAHGGTPVWSPDGKWIAYLDKEAVQPNHLKVVSLDGEIIQDLGISNVSAMPLWVK